MFSEIKQFSNFCWKDIVTPVHIDKLEEMLVESNYHPQYTRELVTGFKKGFDIGYRGPTQRRNISNNLPFRIGNQVDLWNKVMDEVQAKRYAGPYQLQQLPFECFVQSPLGLVPKAENKQRLIFHLSYDFGEDIADLSINHHTPEHLCSLKYKDLDHAVKCCPFEVNASRIDNLLFKE